MVKKRPAAEMETADGFLSPKVTTSRYLPKSPPPAQASPATPVDSEIPESKKDEEEDPVEEGPKEEKSEATLKKPAAKVKTSATAKAKAKASPKSTAKGSSSKNKGKAKAKASPKSTAKGSSSKNKGKAKAIASPKSKSKATPKSKSKSKKKEEQEEEEKTGGKDKNLKRPAAAKSSLRQQTEKWKKGTTVEDDQVENKVAEEEDPEDEEEEGEEEDKRDRNKARAFARAMKRGSLPQGVLDMLGEIEKTDQPRAKKTALINALFEKTAAGTFEMKTESATFQTFKENFKKNTETEKVEGEPKQVFLYRVYHGDARALSEAIQQGHVKEQVRKGVVYCYYPSWSFTQEKGTSDRGELTGQSSLNNEQFNQMSAAFSKVAKKKELLEGAPSSSSKQQLALEDQKDEATSGKPDWSKLMPLLEEAKQANDRLEKDFFKLKLRVESSKDDKLLTNLKTLVVQCNETGKQIGHTLVWKELPPDADFQWTAEGVNKWLFEMATKREALDEGLEQLKAVLKARNL